MHHILCIGITQGKKSLHDQSLEMSRPLYSTVLKQIIINLDFLP